MMPNNLCHVVFVVNADTLQLCYIWLVSPKPVRCSACKTKTCSSVYVSFVFADTMTTNLDEVATWPTVTPADMLEFMTQCMIKVGTKPSHAKLLATVLIAGDKRGHYSHGLNRLGGYAAFQTCIFHRPMIRWFMYSNRV